MERQSYIILAAIVLAVGAALGLVYSMSKPAEAPSVAVMPTPSPSQTATTEQPPLPPVGQEAPAPQVAAVTASAETGPAKFALVAAAAGVALGAFGLRFSLKQL